MVQGFVKTAVVGVGFGDGKEFCRAAFFGGFERLFGTDIYARARRIDNQLGCRRAHSLRRAARKVKQTGSVDNI